MPNLRQGATHRLVRSKPSGTRIVLALSRDGQGRQQGRKGDALELLSKPDVDWDAVCDLSLDIYDLASGLNVKCCVGTTKFGKAK